MQESKKAFFDPWPKKAHKKERTPCYDSSAGKQMLLTEPAVFGLPEQYTILFDPCQALLQNFWKIFLSDAIRLPQGVPVMQEISLACVECAEIILNFL
jgi:hypothetical protein